MEQFGQDVTKRILQVITSEATQLLRSLDSFGRIGATEFAIVMPTTWLDQSQIAIRRLKNRLQDFDWQAVATSLHVGFCTGLTANAPGDQAEVVLERASEALKRARQQGAGSVVQVEADIPGFDFNAE